MVGDKMNTEERRQHILERLRETKKPLTGTALSKEFAVSRQIIVGDISILRALGTNVYATPRGYIIPEESRGKQGLMATLTCRHTQQDMLKELNVIVDNGGFVRDVIVEHPLYGEIRADLMDAAEYVASASEELTSSADQSAQVSGQIANSIVSVAGSCNEQFTSVENASEDTHQLAAHMENFREVIHTSNEKVRAASQAATAGNTEIDTAVGGMQSIETAVQESAGVIAGLGEESKRIGTIVDTIAEIAAQTNLLALNAAIEAARAGEHDVMLASIFGGVLAGIGFGLIFRCNANSGGLDVVGAVVKKYYSYDMGTVIFVLNVAVVALSIALFGLEIALFTFVSIYVTAEVTNRVAAGFNREKSVVIVSPESDRIAEEIMP